VCSFMYVRCFTAARNLVQRKNGRAVGWVLTHPTSLRRLYPTLEREDALIAASALVRGMPLLIGNRRHFRVIVGLKLFSL